ncbi:MAG: hypothetical protein ACK5F7_14885 [Planctomycetaceae bacterium]
MGAITCATIDRRTAYRLGGMSHAHRREPDHGLRGRRTPVETPPALAGSGVVAT